MKKPQQLWIYLRSSFWFTPSLIVAGSIALAISLINADSVVNNEILTEWPRLFGAGAEGSRQMLATIASSMMTVVGVTFSMTLVTLALASNQYTSRVLGNFMRSTITQVALGAFAGIFAYCLIVLRVIRGGDESAFVPSLAVLIGVVLALIGISVLILFIHHIATSIQASNIICSVADETLAAIERVFPEKGALVEEEDEECLGHISRKLDWHIVPATASGYIESIDYASLEDLACQRNIIIRMNYGIGDFVVKSMVLASITGPDPDDKTMQALCSAYSIGSRRTIEQDPEFGIRQIVDIALKALSPGINDTTTAVTCVDYLASILCHVAPRKFPSRIHYEKGKPRLITVWPTFGILMEASFDQIRRNSEGNVTLMTRMLDALQTIETQTASVDRREALREQAQRIAEVAYRSVESPYDLAIIDARLARVCTALEEEAGQGE
ncbi:DUF2254 domain-containing protein [Nitrosospira multiformis]|nr:DUF2254 domain-containing protein [Nitrosospira multiformis]